MTVMTEVKERPILMSGPMVRAILDGRKTQTRRVAKVTDANCRPGMITPLAGFVPRSPESHVSYCPYGQPGDRLWVRETWHYDEESQHDAARMVYAADRCAQDLHASLLSPRATPPYYLDYSPARWRSPIHMPRWASRLTLEITGVRVERVQEITNGDAIAEGIETTDAASFAGGVAFSSPKLAFGRAWDSLNARRGYSWDSNPFVWVISFRPTGGRG